MHVGTQLPFLGGSTLSLRNGFSRGRSSEFSQEIPVQAAAVQHPIGSTRAGWAFPCPGHWELARLGWMSPPVVLVPTPVPSAGLSRSDVNGMTLPGALKMKEQPGQTGPDKHSSSSPSSTAPGALPAPFPSVSTGWRKPRSPLSSPSPLPKAIHPI